MQNTYKKQIEALFRDCINRTIERLDTTDTYRPFHAALLSPEALFWSRFERSFSTSFGQVVIEQVSKIAAIAGGATQVTTQKHTHFKLRESQLTKIESHLANLRSGNRNAPPNWDEDLRSIREVPASGLEHDVRVVSDLFWVKNGINHYMSIKTVKPNIDQTAEAKRDLIKLKLNDPNCAVFYGLYYNPYGENKLQYAWSPPKGIFNFQTDQVVLIGREYWDTLGGAGTYETVLQIANSCGEETRAQVGRLNL
jgi:hypothetical protein